MAGVLSVLVVEVSKQASMALIQLRPSSQNEGHAAVFIFFMGYYVHAVLQPFYILKSKLYQEIMSAHTMNNLDMLLFEHNHCIDELNR